MQQNEFDTIIWGASLQGIKMAAAHRAGGKKVLLAGRFGFPGGKATESLATLYNHNYFNDGGLLQELLSRTESLPFGILFLNQEMILLHPEAIKRVCWELLSQYQVDTLFHVTPMEVIPGETTKLVLFGREGVIRLQAGLLVDMSDDRFLDRMQTGSKAVDLVINSFFTDPLPPGLKGFHPIRMLETPIGQYVSISKKNVPAHLIEQAFNLELDQLSGACWKNHRSRIRMVPVYPEIKTDKQTDSR